MSNRYIIIALLLSAATISIYILTQPADKKSIDATIPIAATNTPRTELTSNSHSSERQRQPEPSRLLSSGIEVRSSTNHQSSSKVAWSELTSPTNVKQVLDQLKLNKSSTEAERPLRLASICLGGMGLSSAFVSQNSDYQKGRSKETQELISDSATLQKAKVNLDILCESAQSPEIQASIAEARKLTMTVSGPLKNLAGVSASSILSQDQKQALILVLSNPDAHSYILDVALDLIATSSIWPNQATLSPAQVALAKTIAYQQLTGDRDPGSVRNLSTCVTTAICNPAVTTSLQTPSVQAAQEAANALVAAIRSQAWLQLIGK